ncbi:MAG: protease HtpX [Bdellovibrio sp. CG10_big_fil_rev_8_21_14_0_10_47_8]|nr:MAG: protease HtpX [Bdellovibrio sp. CG10_big_fil_rev_8_21_14_0_10_47_8]
MIWFKRIGLFLLVNALVIATISITSTLIFSIFGIQLPQGAQGLLILCAIMGFSGSFISLMMSKFIAKKMYGVQIIDPKTDRQDLRWLVETVHHLAKSAGLPALPEVGIYDSPEINAFATGPSKKNSLVAVSTGLLRNMQQDEIEGVLGHEISHIRNGDMVTMALLQGVVNTFVLFLSRILASIIANSGNRDGERGSPMTQWMLTMLFDMVFTILASILVNYFSRRREFRADAGGACLAGKEKMISGLKKLQAQFEMIEPDNGGVSTMKISNRSSGFRALFSTHPPLQERILRLERGS